MKIGKLRCKELNCRRCPIGETFSSLLDCKEIFYEDNPKLYDIYRFLQDILENTSFEKMIDKDFRKRLDKEVEE